MAASMNRLRADVLKTARAMNRTGLNQGTSGNVSVRCDKALLITPSGLAYDICQPDDIVMLRMNGNVEKGRKPSSEWQLHRDIYRSFPDASAILHAHPPWCTTLACLDREIPAFHYMIAVAGGDSIRCAEYALFGTEQLARNVNQALKGRSACLMSHHGMICFADNLEKVLELAIEVENLAKVYCRILHLGKPSLLSREQMNEVLDRFKEYRQPDVC
ncbi:MAG: class II aldolase [Desulfobulbus sp.]|nr:MAG: class II aldolase [Desulfobulbus sp.]